MSCHIFKPIVPSAVIALAAFSSAFAQEQVYVPEDETECDLAGWSVDADPAGLNVRADPSTEARVIGTLPPYVERQDDAPLIADFSITGSSAGWLRIEGARDYPRDNSAPPRPTYAGSGWVAGSFVRFAVQSSVGFMRPDAGSDVVVDLGIHWLADVGTIRRVVACSGEWALIEFALLYHLEPNFNLIPVSPKDPEARVQRAWFRGICPILETTCDELSPDE